MRRVFQTVWAAALVAIAAAAIATGDTFHLTGGGVIEGWLLAIEGDNYAIRTKVGLVRLPINAVERIEVAASPLEEYHRRAAQVADTPADQTDLAAWCRQRGLKAEWRKHLLRAIQLDPDYLPARRALGHVRVGYLWLDGRRVIETGGPSPGDRSRPGQMEDLVRRIRGQWNLRIRAIKQAFLDNPSPEMVRQGRARTLEIKDPLAIFPLSQVLGDGNADCRAVLVEALTTFPQDEATLNLAVLGLVDPQPEIRESALAELARRNDPRVVNQYRSALAAGEVILKRAATGLARLQAKEAIPDLIERLTAVQTKWVEEPAYRTFDYWPEVFNGVTATCLGRTVWLAAGPQLGIPRPLIYTAYDVRNVWRFRPVTVYRTEVLEALKQLTGQNFGFEADQWRRWYQTQGP